VRCRQCNKWTLKKPGERHHLCRQCNHQRRYPTPPSEDESKSEPEPDEPDVLYERDSSSHTRLTEEQRYAIITLYKQHLLRAEIARQVGCDLKTVRHWIGRYILTGTVAEQPRGRKRKTDENTDTNIAIRSVDDPFMKPKQIKAELDLEVAPRTVDRRLVEAELPGRVAKKEHDFKPAHLRARVSFGSGYQNWTKQMWSLVLFSDETHIEMGEHGQIWVRRPVGAALDPKYMAHKQPHPDRVSVWACVSTRGLGAIHIFTENLDAKLMKDILQRHLIQTAHQLFPPGQWWLLWDNDKKHKSKLVQTWLHSKGVLCIDFPAYSPDLNPIENFWNDLKRRVETHNATTTDELQQHIMEEWNNTDTDYLANIADSMPDRCTAVVASKGHKIHY
jgi:transposase